jgi:hypothetical protein
LKDSEAKEYVKALKQLKVVDDDLATYLKITSQDQIKFTYYTFDTKWEEYWNVIGIRYRSRTPFLIDVRLMYIDQDARDWDGFVAERDAPGYVALDPDDYARVIAFFEMLVQKEMLVYEEMLDQDESFKHFSLMSLEELVKFHYPQSLDHAAIGDYYRYMPDEGIQDNDFISIVSLPRWSAQYGKYQVSTLWFITLSQQQLSNPQFDLVDDVDGLGTITYNLQALQELILLLKRRLQPQ